MTDMPWFKCNAGEFLESCMDMPPEQWGYYSRIILFMYARGGIAPFDEGKLRHIWNCSKQAARKARDELLAAGRIERVGESGLTQGRVKRELRLARKIDAIIAAAEAETEEEFEENEEKTEEKQSQNAGKTPDVFSDNALKNNDPEKQIPETRTQSPDIPPIPPAETGGEAKPKKASRRKPETSIPEAFPDAEAIAEGERIFREFGQDPARVRREAANFRDDATAKDKRFRDWMAAWRKWCRNAASNWGRIEPIAKPGTGAGRSDESWRVVMRRWQTTGSWPAEGDQPGMPGGRCLVPETILEEFGYGEEGGQLRLVSGQ